MLGLLLSVLLPTAAPAAIYRCASSDAPPRFSQFPCGNGEAMVLEPLHTVTIPPLSEPEQRLLEALEQEQRARAEQRDRARARAARQAETERRERQQRCEAARTAREALERQRRKGYSLSEARGLDRRDAELAAEEKHNC